MKNNNLEAQIEQSVKETWEDQKQKLIKEFNTVTRQIEDILQLEEYKREGHKTGNLEKSFGSFGALTVNTAGLSSIFETSDQNTTIDQERLTRVADILKGLNNVRDNNESFLLFNFDNNSAEILEKAEQHLNTQAKIFSWLRMARLEAKAKYNASLHDAFFSQFSWSHLDDHELELCSPVIVIIGMQKPLEEQFVALLPLLSSGLPIKIFALQNKIPTRGIPESARAAVSSSSINVEMLPIALQKVFVFQSAFADQHFNDVLSQGLKSSHPGFFSVLCAEQTSVDSALFSRTFPYFIYDPEKSSDFVARFDLSGNPELSSLWVKKDLLYISSNGKETSLQMEATFADYLLNESEATDQFSTLEADDAENANVIALAQYLKLSPNERSGRIPVVYKIDENKSLVTLVPSRNIILQSAEKMDCWQSLREMTGIDNPILKENNKVLEEKLNSEKEEALQKLRTEFESQGNERENKAVANAVQNIARNLMGLEKQGGIASHAAALVSSTDLTPAIPKTSSPVENVDEPASEEISEEVWIESNLCTTCDECTDLNKNIFAYDDKKLAIIKDPKGGPFKDIVKAAELCPAHIIHPGTPQDPNEKNLNKLIEQAEPYQ
ncbi:MAG: ferredoxin [Gammaproteobacteria bacterium]|nr:ferredoxin [Gammaproteobacteria bacterium]